MILASPQIMRGDVLTLGFLSFDNLIPDAAAQIGVNVFDITNLTGDASGDPTFTSVTFKNSSLTVPGGPAIALGDIAAQSFFFNLPAVQFPDTQSFASAEFKATLDLTTFLLLDGVSTFTANSAAIDVLLLPSSGNSLVAGVDVATITVSNSPTLVPEPNSWLLLGSISIWICRRARAATRRL
jgi:hypothetical protein